MRLGDEECPISYEPRIDAEGSLEVPLRICARV